MYLVWHKGTNQIISKSKPASLADMLNQAIDVIEGTGIHQGVRSV